MKICFFDDEPEIYPLQYGGKARTIINLATEFIKQPMIEEVTILSRSIYSKEKEFIKDGVKYISLDDNNTMSMIKKYIDAYDIMNIHCCSFTFPNINGKAKKFYFLHDVLIATADKGSHLDKALGGNFDLVIAPSEFAKSVYDYNSSLLQIDRKCKVISRHINENLFEVINVKKISDDKNCPNFLKNIKQNYGTVIFFPSRPIEEKGGVYLNKIISQLDSVISNYCIIGPFSNFNDLPKNCIDTGWIESDKLKYYYSISDVTLNFSLLPESFSQICIESIYCQTPIVSFKSGNIPDLNKITEAIILVEQDETSIIDGIFKAIAMKKNQNRMNEEQRNIKNEFNKTKIINQYLSLYNDCLNGGIYD